MSRPKSLTISLAILFLFTIGLTCFKLKPISKSYNEFLPKEIYNVSYDFYFKGKDSMFVKSYLPQDNERQRISETPQKVKNSSFSIVKEGQNHRGIWRTTQKRNFHTVQYGFTFKGKALKYVIADDLSKKLNRHVDTKYLKPSKYIEVFHPKINKLANKLTATTYDLKSSITALYTYVYKIPSAPINQRTSALNALEQNLASCNGKARLFVAMCRNQGIPARLKGGLILENTQKRISHLWAEVHIQDKWVPFDVLNGHFAYLPANYLELYTGDRPLITHSKDILFDYSYTIEKMDHVPFINSDAYTKLQSNPFTLIKLSESGIIPKKVLSFLLLLPLAGLLISLLKNVIGLKTYGIFLPVLIAYTLSMIGFISGISLFLCITGLIALFSIPLNRWGLLYTPKIVVLLTLTVLSILVLISIGLYFEISWLTKLSFFPIIVIVIMSERFARAIEEDGYQKAASTIGQTLLVTSFCYLIFASSTLKTLVLIFPEFILVSLMINLFIGKWIGLRVTEYFRFKRLIFNTN
ncbi:7TM domain-containing protein [uncultured Kordia sp.]|uniref:7TM domain-containing protein n=1 Tax=uncultured Kordia sp. TaxID=507699 RepID=UPI0026045E49|nr:7TM domain-containing protein [uncultured Kordia sp.]